MILSALYRCVPSRRPAAERSRFLTDSVPAVPETGTILLRPQELARGKKRLDQCGE